MQNSAFRALLGGNTILVSNVTPVQVNSPGLPGTEQTTAYRIRCLVAGYIAWAPMLAANAAPTLTATAPTLNVPSINTIGMAVGQTEVLMMPNCAWWISSVASGFEVTAGEGV